MSQYEGTVKIILFWYDFIQSSRSLTTFWRNLLLQFPEDGDSMQLQTLLSTTPHTITYLKIISSDA
jgi:hypothetical protein